MNITITELLTSINNGDFDGQDKVVFDALNARARQQHAIERAQRKAQALTAGMEDGDLVKLVGMRKYLCVGRYTFRGFAPRTTAHYSVESLSDLWVQGRVKYAKGAIINVPVDCVELVTKADDRTDVATAA